MPLVMTSGIPAFADLRAEGVELISPGEEALPRMSIGLLDLMPDAALRATDRQFFRLVAAFSDAADISIYPFTLAAEARGARARRYVADHYVDFEDVRDQGVDALIITGANPARHLLAEEAFWEALKQVVAWARQEIRAVLCSCLATHAVLEIEQGIFRSRLENKRWGVYEHHVIRPHPFLDGVADPVVAPHSHWYDLTSNEFESCGAVPLVVSDDAGVHMAVSSDDFYLFFQGHPEYEALSLFKEYKREVRRYIAGERSGYPDLPANYLDQETRRGLEDHRRLVVESLTAGTEPPRLHEPQRSVTANWRAAGESIFRNWLASVLAADSPARH